MRNFVLQTPSLQHVAGVRTVALLWNQPDVFTQISQTCNSLPAYTLNDYWKEWTEVEEKVKSKVWALPLPETCKKELLNIIKPIGMEIVHWGRYHNLDGYSFEMVYSYLPQQFYWSMHGAIDYAKTAESMVKDERLSVEKRFEFACLNCLEDQARHLIKLIPKHRIQKYIVETVAREQFWNMEHRIIIAYFAGTLSGDVDRLVRAMGLPRELVNKHLFQVVLSHGPRATCEYFLQKVSQAEKAQVYFLLPLRLTQFPTCGLIYCWSLLNEGHMFQSPNVFLLTQLLHWPMQPLFMETTKRARPFMASHDCAEVLDKVIYKIICGFEDYDYVQWFRELWRLSPAEHKRYFLNYTHHLENLIATGRIELIQLVLNKAPSRLLKKLLDIKHIYNEISKVLMDEAVISDAALMECKEKAALKSSKDRDNVEKRLRSECVSRLVDLAMERRIIKNRKSYGLTTSSLISMCKH